MLMLTRRTIARAFLAVPGHRTCCHIPGWTAYVGRRWDTYDVAPWNFYNVIWRTWQWAERTVADEGPGHPRVTTRGGSPRPVR